MVILHTVWSIKNPITLQKRYGSYRLTEDNNETINKITFVANIFVREKRGQNPCHLWDRYTRDMYAQENNFMSQINRLLIEMSLVWF